MYLRLTRGRFDPARYDTVVPLVPAITAALRALPGVQDVRVGIDRATGRTLPGPLRAGPGAPAGSRLGA
jgi:hypothetical protein